MGSGVSSPRHFHAISTPYSTSVSVPLYAITARSIATPYSTSVSVPLYAITARSITNQRTSSGVGIGFTFLPHVIIPDKRHGVHWLVIVRHVVFNSASCTHTQIFLFRRACRLLAAHEIFFVTNDEKYQT